MKTNTENNSFKNGISDGLPICIGYLAVSFAFGISAVELGLSVWEVLLISMFNLTSAGQVAGAPIIASGGSFFQLGLTQLVINSRYSLMSVSLSQRLGRTVRLRDRFLIAFGNTDEVFGVSTARGTMLGRRYFYGLILPPFLGWSLGTLLGAALGKVLPIIVTTALGVAIYAMFVAIVVPEMKKNIKTTFAVMAAIALSSVFYYTPVLKNIESGFVVVICAVAVSLLFAFIAPIQDETEDEE